MSENNQASLEARVAVLEHRADELQKAGRRLYWNLQLVAGLSIILFVIMVAIAASRHA